MGKLQFIGALIGELGDRVLDWLEERSDKETEGIEEHRIIEGELVEPRDEEK